MGTIQILTKTYCCVKSNDHQNFNEDLSDDDKNDNNDDKQILERCESFLTTIPENN